MNIMNAILKGNEYVLDSTGAHANPTFARRTKSADGGIEWWLSYEINIFGAPTPANSADGGEYIVVVDDSTGTASVFVHD